MKKILSILLALALTLGAAFALAEGNVTIAVQGMNDFNDYIQSMVVYGDRLLLSSWDRLYTFCISFRFRRGRDRCVSPRV